MNWSWKFPALNFISKSSKQSVYVGLRTTSLWLRPKVFFKTSEKVDFPPSPQCAVAPSLRILRKPDSPHNSPQEFFTLDEKSSLWKHSALALNFWISSGAVLSSTTLSYLCIIIGPLQSVSRILELLFIFPYFPEGQPTGIVNAKADNDHRVSEGPEISSKLWRSDYFFRPD